MATTIRQVVTVKTDGVVEVRSPQLRQGERADVTIVTSESPSSSNGTPQWKKYAGAVNSGNPCSGDNASIDDDLASEAGR